MTIRGSSSWGWVVWVGLGALACGSGEKKSPILPAGEPSVTLVTPSADGSSASLPPGESTEKRSPFLIWDAGHPFRDDFEDGRPFRHWQIGTLGPTVSKEDAGVDAGRGQIQLEAVGSIEQDTMRSVLSAATFPPQSFAHKIEAVVEAESHGVASISLSFGPLGGKLPYAILSCHIISPSETDEIVGVDGKTGPYLRCTTFPEGGSGNGAPFDEVAGKTLVLEMDYKHDLKHFDARTSMKETGEVLFEARDVAFDLQGLFRITISESARKGPKTGQESRIRSRWDNYVSTLEFPGGYLMSYSPLSYKGVPYDDIIDPYRTNGISVAPTFSPDPGSGANVLADHTRMPPAIDGTADLHAALISIPGEIAVTAYTLLQDTEQIRVIVQKFDRRASLDALVLQVFRSRGLGQDFEYTR